MAITILLTLQLMAVYFLILYAGVGFIQDKRFFSSAPKENLEAIPDKKGALPRCARDRLDHRHHCHFDVSGRVRFGCVGWDKKGL